jgi:hypothetical protein
MGGAHLEGQSVGRISDGIDDKTLILKTIDFVHRQLPAWRDDSDRPQEQSENRLSLQLCKFLNSSARNDFPMVNFEHEEYQTGHRSVDLSACPVEPTTIGAIDYTIYEPFLMFECKRLPAPSPDREKEYVTGGTDKKCGGIQRFKLGLHAAALHIVVMIGYVQKHSTRDWYKLMNEWIADLSNGIMADCCVWNIGEELDLLEEDVVKGAARYRSVHSRAGDALSNQIVVEHLWIQMRAGTIRSLESA